MSDPSTPSPWRPIADYPITLDPEGAMGPIVLARCDISGGAAAWMDTQRKIDGACQ